VFRRRRWFRGRSIRGSGDRDIAWFKPDGTEMNDEDWEAGFSKAVAVAWNGAAIPWPGPRGEPVVDDPFLLLFNAFSEDRTFTLPQRRFGAQWDLEISTADPTAQPGSSRFGARSKVDLIARSMLILKRAT